MNRLTLAMLSALLLPSLGCARSSEAPGPALRNLLIISIDTLRADHLGCYGYPRDTSPIIDGLARESLFFERAQTPLAQTLPAHTSLFTGVYPLEHGVVANVRSGGKRFVPSYGLRSFPQFARERGYYTAAFVSAVAVSREVGIAEGFDVFDEPERGQRSASRTNARLLPWIDELDREPFFLWVHYYDPHWPYAPPPPFDQRYEQGGWLENYIAQRRIPASAARPKGEFVSTRAAINGYDGDVRYVDAELGRLIDRMKRRGLWDETAVILLSDHGEALGEHDLVGHLYIYGEHLQIPLLMRIPGEVPRRVGAPISLVDVLPTALALMGDGGWSDFLEQTSGVDVLAEGHAAAPLFSQTSAREREGLPGPAYSLTKGRWKYVHRPEIGDLLFDVVADPFELDDRIAGEAERANALKAELLRRVERYEAKARRLGRAGETEDEQIDPETIEKLRSLGYAD